MTTAMTKSLARAVLIAGLALPMSTLLPATAPFSITQAHAAGPTTVAEFKSVLAAYGKWGTHDKYGDIWVPTVTPPGWHPYPACQWVFTKEGWYFNDTTPWGSIVHHYGRWSHDEQIGWFWVPDQDWSPGWVVWRQSDQWVGWAPMPPQQDYQLVSSAEFNNDKLWIFMAADKFRHGGCGDTVQASQAFYQSYPTNWFGLAPGALVDIDIDQHWTIKNIIKIIKIDVDIDIDIDIDIDKDCPPNTPPRIRMSPFHFDPPKDRRTSNDPTPPGGNDGPKKPPRLSVDTGTPVYVDNGGGTTVLNPVIPLRPIRGTGGRGGNDGGKSGGGNDGGKIRGVNTGTVALVQGSGNGGGSSWTKPHLSILNSYGRGLNLSNPGLTRSPNLSLSPRMTGVGMGNMGGMGGKSVIR
ncbi:MAG TPA: DUF6600 domain-containing protein [Xanthobacteraceae bacterium]